MHARITRPISKHAEPIRTHMDKKAERANHPRATSRIIITRNPAITPTVPQLP